MEIPSKIKTAIDYAARDIARAIVDDFNCHTEFGSIKRSVAFMLNAAAAGVIAKQSKGVGAWTDPRAQGWTVRAADTGPGGLDKDALTTSIQEWWGELDDTKKYQMIMSTHPDTQFINEQVQKLSNKTEADLSKTDPRLFEIYRAKAVPAQKQKQAPAQDLPPEKDKALEPQRPMPEQEPDPGQQAGPPNPQPPAGKF